MDFTFGRYLVMGTGYDVEVKEMPDYPPSTSAVVWDNWSVKDNGTLPYPESLPRDEYL